MAERTESSRTTVSFQRDDGIFAGFPVSMVASHDDETNVEVAFKEIGRVVARGRLTRGGSSVKTLRMSFPESVSTAVDVAATLYERALRNVLGEIEKEPVVAGALRQWLRRTRSVTVQMVRGDRALVGTRETGRARRALRLNVDVVKSFGLKLDESRELVCDDMETLAGLEIAAAIAMVHHMYRIGRLGERMCLHKTIGVYELLGEEQQSLLRRALRSSGIDSGNVFSIFLDSVTDESLAKKIDGAELGLFSGVETETLAGIGEEIGNLASATGITGSQRSARFRKLVAMTGGNAALQAEVKNLRGVLGTGKGNGSGKSAQALLERIERCVKWRDKWGSWLVGQCRVDLPYDHQKVLDLLETEFEDIDEQRALINDAMSSDYDYAVEGDNIERISDWAIENDVKLVCGRLSRAFGNQAHLLSSARYVADKTGLARVARKLARESAGIVALQTQLARISNLVAQPKELSYARMVGAVNHFEEALIGYQKKEMERLMAEKEAGARRVIAKPSEGKWGDELEKVSDLIGTLFALVNDLRDELSKAPLRDAAFVVFLQRLHPAETINLANANACRDVHPGKEEDLRDLTRQGGHNIYSSQGSGVLGSREKGDTHWIIKAGDWIEAIPLFIKERIVRKEAEGGDGESVVEVIETEVDQEGMEAFFRFHAEYWVRNIDAVMDSEHVALARRLLVESEGLLAHKVDILAGGGTMHERDEAIRSVLSSQPELASDVGCIAATIQQSYRNLVNEVAVRMEKGGVTRMQALEDVLVGRSRAKGKKNLIGSALNRSQRASLARVCRSVAKANRIATKIDAEGKRIARIAFKKRREISSLHVLTTESAGMTEGYVQTWLEEEMALYNVVTSRGLESEVRDRMAEYRRRLEAVGERVISQFGMGVVVEEVMAEQKIDRPRAVATVMMSYKPVADEAAKLAVLLEHAERNGREQDLDDASDPDWVGEYVEAHRAELEESAIEQVVETNGRAIEERISAHRKDHRDLSLADATRAVIHADTGYQEELESAVLCDARQAVLSRLHDENPELDLFGRVRTWLRTHTSLAKSNARKEVIAKHDLNNLAMDPLHYYQATGGNKKYNLLYTPSRVNLGEHERDSVVKWRQWVGGADRSAARAGFDFYSLVNEGGVEERPALAYAEIQKTSENALCVTHFAGSNALALLVMAVLEGDVEDMADQMNLRNDRMVPVPGEGYGGYCVPKDGLFLAFVLSLTNEVKLRQIGIPDHLREGVMEMARAALTAQNQFESHFEWQLWAAKKLLAVDELEKYFDVRDNILVFHLTKISEAIRGLGLPWHRVASGPALIANLSARWSVDKMIVSAEQVNRFMVFYKAWLIYQGMTEARRHNGHCPAESAARIALSAEYKPVQDVRYSTGMRLFEILAGTCDHLTHSLDEEGQNLVHLMFHGFDPETDDPVGKRMVRQVYRSLNITERDSEVIGRLKEAFPRHDPPADIVMTSVTMSSTQDMLFYTTDTRLDQIADRVQTTLSDYALTQEQIPANARVYGGDLSRWAGLKQLPTETLDALVKEVGGDIHALVLKMRGPGRDYEQDVQGVDVLNTGIPFPELLELTQNAPKLVSLMLTGNPNSALVIADGAAGRKHRALTSRDVMSFFAACDKVGRRGVYSAIGLGDKNVERLRDEMQEKRARAQSVFDRVAAVADTKTAEKRRRAATEAAEVYEQAVETILAEEEASKAVREEERLKRYGKWSPGDYFVSAALNKLSSRLALSSLDFGTWVAGLGGMYVVIGEDKHEISEMRAVLQAGVKAIAAIEDRKTAKRPTATARPFSRAEVESVMGALVLPKYVPEVQRFAQEMLVETSSKAVEMAAIEALERRKALEVRAARARAFNEREQGFKAVFDRGQSRPFNNYFGKAQKSLGRLQNELDLLYSGSSPDPDQSRTVVNKCFGEVIAYTHNGLGALIDKMPVGKTREEREMKSAALADVATVYTGREIVFEDWKKVAGGYEDMGVIARIAEAAEGDRAKLDRVAKGIELFYTTFCLAQTIEFAQSAPEDVDERMLWKNLTDFFAETINDHWYEYAPWAYSRGVGFAAIKGVELYKLAVERHAWLYRYTRTLLVNRTDLRDMPEDEQDLLLGNFLDGKKTAPIGAVIPDETEQEWRAYNQLREISFTRSDGFPPPEVFAELDPAIISADKRLNLVMLYPAGRTHVSRALREGPTLNRELEAQGDVGTNILIDRCEGLHEVPGAKRRVVLVHGAHLYVSRDEYTRALRESKGLSAEAANSQVRKQELTGALTPKGIKIAARFVRDGKPAPVVAGAIIPFHGLPMYESGEMEDEGLPATCQSLVFSDITYDKSLYPQIYGPKSGVTLPAEIDWMAEYNNGLTESQIKGKIEKGDKSLGFPGLRAFGVEHPIILVKGAAESGARNLKLFEIGLGAKVDEDVLKDVVQFVYDISKKQNVVIQDAVLTSPEFWASPQLMESFVDRQILEWNRPVGRDKYPRSQIYGSLRIIGSSPRPEQPYDTSFPIVLNSLQVATNVGRGGTLEPLLDEYVQEPYRKDIIEGLKRQVPRVMKALHSYARKYAPTFEAHRNRKVGTDLRGVPYTWPPYLMHDFLTTPTFKRPGRLVDIEPDYDETGRRIGSRIILEDKDGRFEGEIAGWRFIHLEPNVGIGLWDRYNLREEEIERSRARLKDRAMDWDNIGVSDRIVLRNFVAMGVEYMRANFGPGCFG